MKPAERIPLLKRLAERLAALDDKAEIDLILRQFGFGTTTLRGNDYYGYALRLLEIRGNDDKRLELERYLEPAGDEASPRPATTEPGPWKIPGSVRLFISHAHSFAPIAGGMKDFLGRYLIEAFVAHADIEPSEKWPEVIEAALLTCHAAAALVTDDFRESAWCDQEIGFCIARSICVVPLLYDDDPHGFLTSYQGIKMDKPPVIDSRYGWIAGRRVMDLLISRADLKERMIPSIVRRYSQSNSYENTRHMIPLLKAIPAESWTVDLIGEAEKAATENDQVYDADFGGAPATKVVSEILTAASVDDIPF